MTTRIPEYLPINGNPGLFRHTKSMGVINSDTLACKRYKTQRDKILKEKLTMEKALGEIETLKNEVTELKSLVYQLIQKH